MDKKMKVITRRDFVQGTASVALGAAVWSGQQNASAADTSSAAPRNSTVHIIRDEKALDDAHEVDVPTLETMLQETLKKVTGKSTSKDAWLSLVKPDDIVGLVFTNHLNRTHDELLTAVRQSLTDAGIPGDNIRDALGGPDKVRPCTALIALPALKAHWLTGIGTVLKNYIMFSGSPKNYHDENNVKLGEIWNMPDVKGKTKIVIVDALRPLCDKGPQVNPSYLWDYKGLISGTDPVAVETVCLKILEAKREEIRKEPSPLTPPPVCVAAADEVYGLGVSKWEEITVQKTGWEKELLI